jgi:hypothetical protein
MINGKKRNTMRTLHERPFPELGEWKIEFKPSHQMSIDTLDENLVSLKVDIGEECA